VSGAVGGLAGPAGGTLARAGGYSAYTLTAAGAGDGFVVHIALDGRDLATLCVLTRVPHQNDEVSISLDTHGLIGWVPLGVKVPADVAEQALSGFFETQGAENLPGWAWEYGAQAQDLRFS
jgi:hypothetical protein